MNKGIRIMVVLLAAACLCVAFAANAYAYDGFWMKCGSCHSTAPDAVSVSATLHSNDNVTAVYSVTVTGAEEWALFAGDTKRESYAGSGTETVTVPAGATYNIYGVAGDPSTGAFGSTSISPDDGWVDPTPESNAPVSVSDAVASYVDRADITITASDDSHGTWGVDYIYFQVDGGTTRITPIGTDGYAIAAVWPTTAGESTHTVTFWAQDWNGNTEASTTETFTVTRDEAGVMSGSAEPTVIGPNGRSAFTYQDLQDAFAKYEGGYAAYGGISGWYANPHGGYDTSTNKCKVCHAVHRAEGAYYLLRADSQDDACDYCHIGGSAHSSLVVYDDGKYTTNGHTIGAQSEIPDSSVDQWTEQVTLETTDADGDPVSETIMVRAYDEAKNQMYRFTRHHGHGDWGTGSAGYGVVGPLALRCMNCHQTHNASAQVWRPAEIEAEQTVAFGGGSVASGDRGDGYKLLKRFPAGSTVGTANSYGLYEPGQVVKVPETTLTAGFNYSTSDSAEFTYTEYADGEFAAPIWVAQHIGPEAGDEHGADRDADSINEAALSVWCADCHNLNIGGADMLENEELGFKAHTERTHPAPFVGAYTGPGQCYSCHRSDGLAPVMGGTYDGVTYPSRGAVSGCTQCHYGTSDYYFNRMNPVTAIDSDFPHSGGADSIKLLGSYSVDPEDPTTIDTTTVITSENLDAVCLRCHGGIGSNH